MAAAAILDFQNLRILAMRRLKRVKVRYTMPNFASIGQTVAEIWPFFDFPKMAAIRHLRFVMSVFGPPMKGIWWSLSLCKIWLELTQ